MRFNLIPGQLYRIVDRENNYNYMNDNKPAMFIKKTLVIFKYRIPPYPTDLYSFSFLGKDGFIFKVATQDDECSNRYMFMKSPRNFST